MHVRNSFAYLLVTNKYHDHFTIDKLVDSCVVQQTADVEDVKSLLTRFMTSYFYTIQTKMAASYKLDDLVWYVKLSFVFF